MTVGREKDGISDERDGWMEMEGNWRSTCCIPPRLGRPIPRGRPIPGRETEGGRGVGMGNEGMSEGFMDGKVGVGMENEGMSELRDGWMDI